MSKPKKVEKQLTDEYAQYLRELIEEAGRVDAGREVFGAEKHKYRINPVVNMAEIRRAEEERHVKFPEEYVFYLTKVGNGGAGPYYGLYPFEKVLAGDRNPYLGQIFEQTVTTQLTKEQWSEHMRKLDELGDETIAFLEELAFADEEVTDVCCVVLLQMKQEKGVDIFGRLLAEKRIPAICCCISSIRRLPMEVRSQFYRQVLQILEEIQSEEGKSVYWYLMDCEQFRAGDIVEYVRRIKNKELLKTAIYVLGKSRDALDYVELFIEWMKSEDYWIAHTALQAMSHKRHEKLIPVYRWMDEKYKEDSTMQSNLRIAMKNCGDGQGV